MSAGVVSSEASRLHQERTKDNRQDLTYIVDSSRLSCSRWFSHGRAGEGDIVASYSSDWIALKRQVRKPFEWRNEQWIAVTLGPGSEWASAYRLVPAEAYEGEDGASLDEKLSSVDDARRDPRGLHHGVSP